MLGSSRVSRGLAGAPGPDQPVFIYRSRRKLGKRAAVSYRVPCSPIRAVRAARLITTHTGCGGISRRVFGASGPANAA